MEHPRAREALTLRLSAAVDHGRSLRTGADAVRAEGRLRQAGDDAAARRPTDRLGIICALVHIGKRHQVIHHGGTRRTPEEGHDLGAGAGLVRCKEAVTNAAGDAVLCCPLDGLVVIGVIGYVIEEVENAVVLHEGHLDLHLARRHGECVFPVALVGELQIVAVLIGDGNGFQHIAAVGFHRDRHGAARRGVLRTDRHGAILGLAGDGDRITGRATGAAAGRLPLGNHRLGLSDPIFGICIGEVFFTGFAVPVFNVAFFCSGGGLCVNVFQVGVAVRVKAAVTVSTNLTYGLILAGRFAAGVLRVAVLSRVIRHIAVFIVTFISVMRCIGRPIGLPAVAGGVDWLRLCRAAFGAGICPFTRFCAGRRCCYRTAVPSMRAYVILFIATGTLLPVHVIIMCPTGSKIMSQSIAIFRTANCACCSLGAGCRTAGVLRLMKHRAAGADLPVFRFVGFPVVALVVMGVALSIEHGQGLARCGQILAFVCPRVSIVVAFASLEQRQHRAVGKFRGGFGGSIEICVRVAQIVAVGGSVKGGDCDFTNISATSDFADIIAVGNLSAHIKSADTSGVATAVVASAGDFADVIAIADY